MFPGLSSLGKVKLYYTAQYFYEAYIVTANITIFRQAQCKQYFSDIVLVYTEAIFEIESDAHIKRFFFNPFEN